jgi:methyl-accepting chemotaxis protein
VGAIIGQLDDSAVALQYHYIKANPNPLGSKDALDRAADKSQYSHIHEQYHPIIRSYLQKFGYYNIFLVHPETGKIVYSVFKELDFATSLKNGPYAGTKFAEAFRRANAATTADTVVFADFKGYFPSYEAPAGFVASPIFRGDQKLGVLIFQFPIDNLNAIMKERAGMGESGETYLVGHDLLMRSDSYLDPEHHSVAASFRHPDKGKVDTEAAQAAVAGRTDEKIIIGYSGNPVLSAYAPLTFEGLNWALLAEIDEAEAFAAVKALQWVAVMVAAVGIAAIVAVALLVTRAIVRPIQGVVAGLTDLSRGEGDLTTRLAVSSKDEIGQLAQRFNEFMEKLHAMIKDITKGVETLATLDIKQQIDGIQNSTNGTVEAIEQIGQVITNVNEIVSTIATAVEEQSVSTQEIADNISQVSNGIAEVNENVAQSTHVASKITQSVNEVNQAVNGMANSSSQVRLSAEELSQLAEQLNEMVGRFKL